MTTLEIYYLIPMGFAIFLEIFLSGMVIALIGAAGYTFFVYSMEDDRIDKKREMYRRNPWEVLGVQGAGDPPEKSRRVKRTVIGILLLTAAVIVLLLLIQVIYIVYPGIQIS